MGKIELIAGCAGLANRLFKAGIQLVFQEKRNGHTVFIFEYEPGQTAIVQKVLNDRR